LGKSIREFKTSVSGEDEETPGPPKEIDKDSKKTGT
jgi:Sec-independent protein translocase protein TatA